VAASHAGRVATKEDVAKPVVPKPVVPKPVVAKPVVPKPVVPKPVVAEPVAGETVVTGAGGSARRDAGCFNAGSSMRIP
jgi:hypothetical protein